MRETREKRDRCSMCLGRCWMDDRSMSRLLVGVTTKFGVPVLHMSGRNLTLRPSSTVAGWEWAWCVLKWSGRNA